MNVDNEHLTSQLYEDLQCVCLCLYVRQMKPCSEEGQRKNRVEDKDFGILLLLLLLLDICLWSGF